jgi:hypothetical protein
VEEKAEKEEEDGEGQSSSGSDRFLYPCQYEHVHADEMREEGKELKKIIAEMERKRDATL